MLFRSVSQSRYGNTWFCKFTKVDTYILYKSVRQVGCVWTIGWGTTVYPSGQKVKKGDKITLEQAKQYKAYDLARFEKAVNDAVKVPLNQNQFNALVSLAYNIGEKAFAGSTLVKRLNEGNYKAAADQFLVWVNAGGKRMQGLINRRNKEREVFLK